ncbi:MAG: adenylosuccinate lyase [Bacteroidia bacterium]|nr:adenylosuccinate lyase [Bacteroidia bacterium]
MKLTELTAISPVDGRYFSKAASLSTYFSEFALMRYRVWVEAEYFIALSTQELPGLPALDPGESAFLRALYLGFSDQDALRIKEIERTTNHDVKAVEYFIKEKLAGSSVESALEYIHFGLTSQDVNNTAIPLSLKHFHEEVFVPLWQKLIDVLRDAATEWKDVSLLARTHGQPASPTKLGKEMMVFAERLEKQLQMLDQVPFACKFGGATGNFNAHHVAFPHIDWVQFSNTFTAELGLSRSQHTTQIEHYDMLAAYFDGVKRLNNIVLDLDRDMWTYISMEYFKQKTKAGEVGSSAMPHKVNPIDFENSEGNIGIANALLEHLASKLPVSRLQRDLTDSTVLRNIGVPLAHTLIAIESTLKGWGKLLLNARRIEDDLLQNWAVVAEAIQTILRREGYPKPYEKLKELTRGTEITENSIKQFIESLEVSENVKNELRSITPLTYTGVF